MRSLPVAVGWLLAVVLAATAWGQAEPSTVNRLRLTIDATATLAAARRSVEVTGRFACASCESFTLGLTATQRKRGALAQGGVVCRCGAGTHDWVVRAKVRNLPAFTPRATLVPGRMRVCAWVVARSGSGEVADAHQWCRWVRVVEATLRARS